MRYSNNGNTNNIGISTDRPREENFGAKVAFIDQMPSYLSLSHDSDEVVDVCPEKDVE